MSGTFFIETYGCQMNKAESSALEHTLLEHGWDPSPEAAQADLIVINTCSVRETAEERIWGRLGYYKSFRRKHPHTLAVMGCMAERLGDKLRERFPNVDIVVGTFQKESFKDLLAKADPGPRPVLPSSQEYQFASNHGSEGAFKAFVPVMHGCNNFCSYCIVPYVRGPEISRSPEHIVREMKALVDQGVVDITLLGQNVNSYRYENYDFTALLELILKTIPELPWLRFLTSHPKDVSIRLIDLMANEPRICRMFHLPVQHGSNRILAAMNRTYTREAFFDLVQTIREKVKDIEFTTDLMVGFPGETDEDYLELIELVEKVRFSEAFMYRYNPREGTAAHTMVDSVPEATKSQRLSNLIALQQGISRSIKVQKIGQRMTVLCEEKAKRQTDSLLGRTQYEDRIVVKQGSLRPGMFCQLRIDSLNGNTFMGVQE